MVDAVDNAYDAMIANLTGVYKGTLVEVSNAYNAEDRINNLRNDLRDSEIEEIENNRKTYQTSVYYIDIVNQLERMGDFIINISEELEKTFIRK
jgi:phosphate:Na+ symporter